MPILKYWQWVVQLSGIGSIGNIGISAKVISAYRQKCGIGQSLFEVHTQLGVVLSRQFRKVHSSNGSTIQLGIPI